MRNDVPCLCNAGRRDALRGLACVLPALWVPLAGASGPDIAVFVARAFEMKRRAVARGDQPYGAIVVKDGRIVGEGVSAVILARDPTAHAEREAMRDAARRLGTTNLSGCDLYGTSRACAMCEAAAHEAGIARMYYGREPVLAGAPQGR